MIIGISGKRGVGKTVAAKYLEKQYGFKRVSFADELRRLSRCLMPFTEADFADVNKKEAPFKPYDWSPRDFLVSFGDFMRYWDKDYWANVVFNTLDPKKDYVIDDMRYKNEFVSVNSRGGFTVRINRFVKENPFGKPLDIASETDLDDAKFDYVVEDCRNTSLRRLYDEMEHVHATASER